MIESINSIKKYRLVIINNFQMKNNKNFCMEQFDKKINKKITLENFD
jgi:hypothetical protein